MLCLVSIDMGHPTHLQYADRCVVIVITLFTIGQEPSHCGVQKNLLTTLVQDVCLVYYVHRCLTFLIKASVSAAEAKTLEA